MNQPALFSAQVTTLTRDVDELPQLYFAVDSRVLQRRLQSNHAAKRRSGTIKDPDGRAKNLGEQLEWPCDEQRQAFGSLKRGHFWHQFAKHNMEKSDYRERDRNSQDVRDICCPARRRNCFGQRFKQARQSWLSDPTQRQRCERHSELCG